MSDLDSAGMTAIVVGVLALASMALGLLIGWLVAAVPQRYGAKSA